MDSLPSFESTQPIPEQAPDQGSLPPFEATKPPNGDLPAFEDTQDPDAKPTGKDRGAITAALEGAGQGIAGPLAPLAEKRFGKVKSEDIKATEEAHPIAHVVGELGGFGASMLTGVGEAGLLAKAGQGVVKGAEALGIGSKIAQGAAKAAVEMGLLQAGNEATQAILDAPNSTGAIASHIGLSAMLGGVTGGAFSVAGQALNKFLDGPVANEFLDRLAALQGGEELPGDPKSAGHKLAELWNQKINSGALSQTIGQAAGAGLGHTVLPDLGGAYIGKEFLGPPIAAVLKPTFELFPAMDANAFRQAITMASAIYKGNSTVNKVMKTFLMPAGTEIINNLLPSDKDLQKLDNQAKEMNGDLQGMMNIPRDSGKILPDHAMQIGKTAGDVVTYINQQRPNPQAQAPLDTKPEVTPAQNTAFKRTLTIAQQPLAILKHVKDGTLTVKDIQDMTSMYPEFTKSLQAKVADSIATHTHNEIPIPYHTRLSMGMFLQEPLDSTMKPESIIAAQPKPKPEQQPQKVSKNSAKIGDKTNSMYKTADQTAESDRSSRKS